MSVESADENFERKRNEMKTMVGLEIAKTQKTLGFPGHWEEGAEQRKACLYMMIEVDIG